MDNEGSPVRFVRLDEEGYTYLINRLVKRMPTALKGVVTESGPGPVAPNYSDGSTDSPLQFKHPQTATDCNGKTETKFTARFQRNRVNGGKSVQLSTSADKWSVTLGQFYSFCEHCFADPMWTVIKNASDKLDDGYSERKIVPIPAARDRAERWPAAMSQDEKDEEQTEQRRLDGQKHTSVAQRARNFVAWGAKLSGMGRESLPVPGHKVHAYDMERFFVKPWTAGCGMGVALMTNASPIQCEVMISHAWGEDMESLYTTLKLHEQQQNPSDFNTNTRIWFCLFGLYQGAGAELITKAGSREHKWYKSGSITLVKNGVQDTGPSVDQQVGLPTPPFEQAIQTACTMLVLHINAGSSCDPYRRVWVRPSPFI